MEKKIIEFFRKMQGINKWRRKKFKNGGWFEKKEAI